MKIVKGSVDSISMAGVTVARKDAVVLFACNGTNGYYDTMRRNGVAYQVPTGMKLILVACRLIPTTTGTSGVTIGYADTAVSNSASGGTNDTTLTSAGGTSAPIICTGAGVPTEQPIYFEVAASKYPRIVGGTNLPVACFLGLVVPA